MTVFCPTLRIGPYVFYMEKFITQFKTTEKNIGHRTRCQRNDDSFLWRSPAVKKKGGYILQYWGITLSPQI